ncbi:MAG: hypothetical protein IT539_04385, partial [Bradyrhizobiaceae bacterium]|nr:hypothetical protein [Bradyrhizobiaceae bacterium]
MASRAAARHAKLDGMETLIFDGRRNETQREVKMMKSNIMSRRALGAATLLAAAAFLAGPAAAQTKDPIVIGGTL